MQYNASPLSYEDLDLENEVGSEDGLVKYADLEKALTKHTSQRVFTDQRRLYHARKIEGLEAKIITDRRRQALAMKEGLETIIPFGKLLILTAGELQDMLSGADDVDVEDWRKNTLYYGEYENYRNDHQKDHPTIEMFWTLMAEKKELRLKLIKFSTGYRRMPLGGFAAIYKDYMIEYLEDKDTFPRTNAW